MSGKCNQLAQIFTHLVKKMTLILQNLPFCFIFRNFAFILTKRKNSP